jgi:hypothetical protein
MTQPKEGNNSSLAYISFWYSNISTGEPPLGSGELSIVAFLYVLELSPR